MATPTATDSVIARVEQFLEKPRNLITIGEYYRTIHDNQVALGWEGGFGGVGTLYYFSKTDVDYLHNRFFNLSDRTFSVIHDNGDTLWEMRAKESGGIGGNYYQSIGLYKYYQENKNSVDEKLADLMCFSYGEAKKTNATRYGARQDTVDLRIKDLLEEFPNVFNRNVKNFEEYYGFKKWDEEVVRHINSEIDKDSPSSSILNKAYLGAGVYKEASGDSEAVYVYTKNGGATLAETIPAKRIDLVSREMWWNKDFDLSKINVNADVSTSDKSRNASVSFSAPVEKAPNQPITARFKVEDGFSSLSSDELKLDDGYLNFLSGQVRSSEDWHRGEFSPKFLVLLTYDNTLDDNGRPFGYSYTSNEADNLVKDEILNFLKQKLQISSIKERGFLSVGLSSHEPIDVTLKIATVSILMNGFREDWWKSRADIINAMPEATSDQVEAALAGQAQQDFQEAEEAAEDARDQETDPPDEDEEVDKLTADEKKRRNLVLKQCALMTNLPEMSDRHIKGIVSDERPIHRKNGAFSIYQSRFYMVRDGNDQGDTVNRLLVPPFNMIKDFVEMKPEVHAHLVPKIRLFKVQKDPKTLDLEQIEFIFPKQMNSTRINNLKNANVHDRGAEFGIKEFSFVFDGTNPATARNDIKAKLSLYFQSFKDFIEKRPQGGGRTLSYVELLLHPDPEGKKKRTTINSAHPEFYDAKNYRIKVDVGWELGSTEGLTLPANGVTQLREALYKTNKTFYLNMNDHAIDFRDDGSVQIDVNYTAYAETATKGTQLDALSSHETRFARDQARKDYFKVVNDAKCSPDQLARILNQLEQMEELVKRQSFQSIYRRLLENNSILFALIDENTSERSFRRGRFDKAVKLEFTDIEEHDLNLTADYREISYFYLGDLLYVILDSLYQQEDKTLYAEGAEKFKFILSSFQYENPFKPGQIHTVNLGSIPIATELFKEWFTDNVLKSERKVYPIMYFLRDLCKYLITEILTENCFKKSLNKKLEFIVLNFTGLANSKGGCRMREMYPNQNENSVVADLNTYYGDILPLLTDNGGGNHIKDIYNYILVHPKTPKIALRDNTFKRGNKIVDGSTGLFHYQIGRDRGLVKKIKFSKTDIPGMREARYFNNGFDGIMQLANVYSVTLEMIGNTIYYPGMEIYVDPVGFLGGTNSDFNPSIGGSIANRLGFGGYHIVTSVRSSIGPGKFTTTVDALFSYSGDGVPQRRYGGVSDNVRPLSSPAAAGPRQTNCTNIIDHVERNALSIADGRTDRYSPIGDDLIRAAAAQAGVEDIAEDGEPPTETLPGTDIEIGVNPVDQ